MMSKNTIAAAGCLVLASAPAVAQAPPKPTTTAPPAATACAPHPGTANPPGTAAPGATTGQTQPLGEKLAKTDGVLCPPTGIDPEIRAPAPDVGTMRVIPPPGTPGGDPTVRPK